MPHLCGGSNKTPMKQLKTLTALSLVAALTACGGGGGDDSTTAKPAAATAEGFWTGTTSNGLKAYVAILENGETWGFYTNSSGTSLAGAFYGNSTSSGTSLSGSGLDFYNGAANVTSYSGTFAPKSTLAVTMGNGVRVNGSYSTDYDKPASLATLAGTYYGYGLTAKSAATYTPVTFSSSGTITAGNSFCSMAGTATPRASGKNVFDLRVTFTGSACALPSGTSVNGIAYYDAAARTLLAMGLNGSKNDGFIYTGTK